MNLLERDEFIKASPAIQIQGSLTHLQRRAWNVLLANAYDELPNQDIHRVSVAELAKSLGFNSHNEDYLKDTLEALVDCVVKWNLLGKDKKEKWGVAALLGSAEIENGILQLTYSFTDAHLAIKLYNHAFIAKLNLRYKTRFTPADNARLILWEICFDYSNTARITVETPFIPLDTFKELMGIALDDAYPTFKTLNPACHQNCHQGNQASSLTSLWMLKRKRIGRRNR